MKRLFCFIRVGLICSFLLVASFAVAKVDKPPVFDLPRLSEIVIDGDGADWGEGGFRVTILADSKGRFRSPQDFDVTFRLAWNEAGLLLLATVRDDEAVEGKSVKEISDGDNLELFCSPRPGAEEYVQIRIAPGIDPTFPEPRYQVRVRPEQQEFLDRIKLSLARKQVAGGYQLELLFPWDNFGITPRVGTILPFQFCAQDKDEADGSIKLVWNPKEGGGSEGLAGRTYLLRLAQRASPAIITRTISVFERGGAHLKIVTQPDYIGRPFVLQAGRGELARGEFSEKEGRAWAELMLPLPPQLEGYREVSILDGKRKIGCFALTGVAMARAKAIATAKIVFSPYCFTGADLPEGDFENPGLMQSLIGPYSIGLRYFDADFNPVTRAEKPGRYGAVLEVIPASGKPLRRFRTLCKLAEPATLVVPPLNPNPELFTRLGAAPQAVTAESGAINDTLGGPVEDLLEREAAGAVLLAGLYELGNANVTDFADNARARDRQWWVTFKRKFYGLDRVYNQPVISPRRIIGEPARVVRTGSLAEAGMKPDAAEKIDAVCREWAERSQEPFSVCIVRHGVIVLHKAYGHYDGRPMTVQDKCGMYSVGKTIATLQMMQLLDQGLLSLDDPIEKYLPALRGVAVEKPITIYHLYSHTSGLFDNWGDQLPDMEEVVGDIYPYLEVGQRFSYNGAGFALGSKIVEAVSGEAYPQFCKRHLFEPLGCNDVTLFDSCWDIRIAPLDLAKVGQLLLNGGTYGDQLFFSRETFALMPPSPTHPTQKTKAIFPFYGIGLSTADWLTKKWLPLSAFGHGTLSEGFLVVDPVNDTVIVMTRENAGEFYWDYLDPFFGAIAEGMAEPGYQK